MNESAVKFMQWKKCDPLEAFSEKLSEKIGSIVPFRIIFGGGAFSVFAEGEEMSRLADVTFDRVDKNGARPLDRIKKVLAWPFKREGSSAIIQISRDPDPNCLAEDYSLYIRINDCPEVEEPVLAACRELSGKFTGGIFVYSETRGEEKSAREISIET